MSTLLVQGLKTELSQVFNLKLSERYMIGAFSPYLYIHNAPAGTFLFEVIKNSVTIFESFFTSDSLLDDMGTIHNHAHVFFPFMPDFPVQLSKGEFTVKLSASGYTYTDSSFIGWVQQHENIQNEMDYVPVTDDQNSLAMRLKIYKQGLLV
jgi:hypothetical protein